MYITIILAILCVALVIWIFLLMAKDRKQKKDMLYLREKLSEIMQKETTERIKFMTTDLEMQKLLVVLNELLDYNHANLMKYNHSQLSMKKMLSNISHDLKTPLTVIQGYLEMLELKYTEEEAVHKAYKQTQTVITLMNQFFDLAKLESGDKEIPIEKVDLSELCRVTILDYYQMLEEMEFQIDIRIPEQASYGLGNANAVKRILNNLISNAIKYGNDGKYLGIVVSEEADKILIQIIDHGKGIEEQHRADVFERMYTLEDSRSRKYQGSGLGLTITKELVEILGGEIHLDSKPYVETIFSFTIPKLNF